MSDTYGIAVSCWLVWATLRRARLTYKKGTTAFREAKADRQREFLLEVQAAFGPHVVALDEAAFFLNHVRSYAWSARGTRAVVPRPAIRGKMMSLLLAVSTQGVVAWSLDYGGVKAVRFSQFLRKHPRGTSLILDNAAIHRATNVLTRQGLPTVRTVAESGAIDLRYLPPYSPLLNPVELCFNTIRTFVNAKAPGNVDQLRACVSRARHTHAFGV